MWKGRGMLSALRKGMVRGDHGYRTLDPSGEHVPVPRSAWHQLCVTSAEYAGLPRRREYRHLARKRLRISGSCKNNNASVRNKC